jgi:hypothetical protein
LHLQLREQTFFCTVANETGEAGELEPEPVTQEIGGQLLPDDFDRLSREDEEASGGVE